MSALKNWLVKVGILSPKLSAELSTISSKVETKLEVTEADLKAWIDKDFPRALAYFQGYAAKLHPTILQLPQVSTTMHATKVKFHRLHKFVEGGTVFTPQQQAAASYKVLVGSAKSVQQSYAVPAAALNGVPPQGLVACPFAALGFVPVPGVEYFLNVVASLDGVDSPVSETVKFTNSLTPAAADTVSVE